MPSTVSAWEEIQALPGWRTVDFISDLHLHAADPATLTLWQQYLQDTPADAVFILGDLFEVWVGDDCLDAPDASFETLCVHTLRQASARRALFFMHGNRDFLAGPQFAREAGLRLLADPSVLVFAGQRILLSHGDALCLDDLDYMAFRAQVRQAAWQCDFLAQPLPERQARARGIRAQSEARKRQPCPLVDLDTAAIQQWLLQTRTDTMIHGHTHRPADHRLGLHDGQHRQRIVLSDWDAQATPIRAEVLRLDGAGLTRLALHA
jgi:UDP-2,3-diacylglucosamine hydrolase